MQILLLLTLTRLFQTFQRLIEDFKEMDGETLIDKLIESPNNMVSRAALEFNSKFMTAEADELFSQPY